jgi:hypothetical protein
MVMSLARCGALLMLFGLVAGCGINLSGVTAVPPQMSSAQLRASGKGVLIVSARFVTTTMTTPCATLQLTHAGDGRQIYVVMSGYSPFTVEQPGDGVLVDPGTYIAAKAYCQRGDIIFVVQAPDPRGLAKVSIGAGEVVDAGTLVVTDDFKAVLTPYLGKSNFWVFARPRIEPLPAGLSRELAAQAVHRAMTAIDPPPYEALAQICNNQRQHAKTLWFGSGGGDPPLCQLIGPPPSHVVPARKQRPGQPI